MDTIKNELLAKIADLHKTPEGAYNIRANGSLDSRCNTANIEIVSKTDKDGIDIIIKPNTKNESVHIPVIISESGFTELVYNDFYIGEIRLPMNMNLSALFGDNRAVYGISAADTTATAYSEYLGGNISLEAFTNSFLQNMPFAPICFRMGALIYSNDITPAADSDMSNTYKNIYEWTIIN